MPTGRVARDDVRKDLKDIGLKLEAVGRKLSTATGRSMKNAADETLDMADDALAAGTVPAFRVAPTAPVIVRGPRRIFAAVGRCSMTPRAFASSYAVLVIVGSGCMAGMGAHAPAQPAASHDVAPADMSQVCPMAVPGTQLAISDTPDGEAVTFTTAPERVTELRSRVHAMADMHNRHHAQGGAEQVHGEMQHGAMMGGEMMGGGMGGMDASMMPPPSRASVEDVDGGARLVVTPNDPADRDRLRSTIRMHAQHMQETGTCGHGQPAAR